MDPRQIVVKAFAGLPAEGTEPQVLLNRELAKYAPALRHERDAEPGDRLGRHPDQRFPTQPNVTSVYLDGAHDGQKRRRFPCPVGADQTDGFSRFQPEPEPAHSPDRRVANIQSLDLEDLLRHPCHPPTIRVCPNRRSSRPR